MVNKIKYYEVGDAYDVEGRGPFESIANFYKKEIAEKYKIGKGNYGHNAEVREKVLFICDSILDINELESTTKRERALSKLTDEEKSLLGLK